MTFQNVRCWDPDLVGKVMDTEALQISDAIFMATHHPAKMYRQDLRLADSHIAYDEKQFLVDFLDDKKDFVFTAVLGGSGTGKSHLIRWLSLSIPRNEKRRVLLIPKVGTNLREVIRLILQDMEGPQFDRYRERLEMTNQSLSENEAREVLLNQLAVAVGPNGPHASDELSDAEGYLQEELPNLLYDPFFRGLLLKKGGFIDRLTTHILGRSDQVERLEERREFSLEDLPIDIVNHEKASEKARGFYEFLISDPEFQPETVAWLNKNLDAAIGQVLNFKGDDLFNLLLEVREALAEQDIELVVLVEDFAKLQGIDHQLLEALLVRPDQPGRKRLCALRTALAVTTGYFYRLGDTVRQRINFRVNLDIAANENDGMLTLSDLVQFVSRYLNVVRLKNNSLADWFSGRSRGEGITPPNACAECPHIDRCQTGFGEVGGVSIYPFTETAIQKMFLRVSPEKFNPRLLLNDVLRLTLENYGDALSRGQFPPPALLERLGGSYMEPLLKSKVERSDTVNHARRKVLLELWTRGNELVDVHPIIHEAFNLPPLGGTIPPVGDQGNDIKQGKPEQEEKRKKQAESVLAKNEPEIPGDLAQKIEELKNWANGQSLLSQKITQELREIVYQSVTNHIDWDGEILLGGFFKGDSKPFRRTSVNFVNQSTQSKKTSIELTIPLEEQNRTQVAIVLQGLLCFEHFGHWNFPNGDTYLMAYAKHLEQWSKYVLRQVQQTLTDKGEWDPVPAVVELLAVGTAMAGLAPPHTPLPKQLSELFFRSSCVDLTNRSPSWRKLYEEFEKHRQALQEILISRIGCTKGGGVP
ncbi:hypothetical protein JCM14036_12390 [Desulfotomaculum defluvii]